jgi:hypothetical protein
MQCQLENTESIGVTHQAIRHNLHDGGVIRSAGPYRELTDTPGGISNPVGILRGEALVDMIVPIENHIRVMAI